MIEVHGQVDDGWGRVADAFRNNFDQHGELGAACCVYVDGRPVLDVWGGIADRRSGRPWDEDTVVVVFSTTKGATAICAHMLAERGELDLDAPVASYWPAFAAEGKHQIPVHQLLSHQAGLPAVDGHLTLEEACAWDPVIRMLEQQKPLWEPGTRESYHAWTFGFLVGEVVGAVSGKTPGTFFWEEVARPLTLSSWIGLPSEVEPRVAHIAADPAPPADIDALLEATLAALPSSVAIPDGLKETLETMWTDPDSLALRAGQLGGAFPQLVTEDGGFNLRLVRAAEHPGSNMVSDARSLARMYAATIGEVDGVRLLDPGTVEQMSARQSALPYGVPEELEAFWAEAFPSGFSLGFFRPTRQQPLLGPRSFGHPGAGGSLAFGDPDSTVGFGYVMNHMAPDFTTANNLVAAVTDCVAR